MKKKFAAPKVHDYKLKVMNGDRKVQGKNIAANLDAISKICEEHITLSCRAKDANGRWYFNVISIPLKSLKSGDEIDLGIKRMGKLVVK